MKILLIDDEKIILKGLSKMLKIKGFEVETAENGHIALKKLESLKPDLIITDIIMPEKDGIEVIMGVKQKSPEIKIIAISGGGRINAENHLYIAQNIGADAILTKPFSTAELIEKINEIMT